MQVMWMILVTLGLVVSGILGLALVAHIGRGPAAGEPPPTGNPVAPWR